MIKPNNHILNELYNVATMPPMIMSFVIAIIFGIAIPFIASTLVSVATLSVFLNKTKPVADNKFFSFLSWFLLPIPTITFNIYEAFLEMFAPMKRIEADEIIMISLMLFHLFLLIRTFYLYQKLRKSELIIYP